MIISSKPLLDAVASVAPTHVSSLVGQKVGVTFRFSHQLPLNISVQESSCCRRVFQRLCVLGSQLFLTFLLAQREWNQSKSSKSRIGSDMPSVYCLARAMWPSQKGLEGKIPYFSWLDIGYWKWMSVSRKVWNYRVHFCPIFFQYLLNISSPASSRTILKLHILCWETERQISQELEMFSSVAL